MKRSFLLSILLFTIFSSISCQDKNALMKINYQGKIYTQEELDPILEKARNAFDQKLLQDQDYYKIVKVTDKDVIRSFVSIQSKPFFNKNELVFISKHKKDEHQYESEFSDYLSNELCEKEYTDTAIIDFYQKLSRPFKFKMLNSSAFFRGYCQKLQKSKKLQEFFLREIKEMDYTEEELEDLYLPVAEFMTFYKVDGYQEEIRKHIHSYYPDQEYFLYDEDFLKVLFDDGYEEEAFNHFQYLLGQYIEGLTSRQNSNEVQTISTDNELLVRFLYSANFKVREKAIKLMFKYCEKDIKGTSAFYNMITSLWSTDVIGEEQRKRIVKLILENKKYAEEIGQSNIQMVLEEIVFKSHFSIERLKNDFNYTGEQLELVKSYKLFLESNNFDIKEIQNDLEYFQLFDKDFNYDKYKIKMLESGVPQIEEFFKGELVRRMMNISDRYFGFEGLYNYNEVFEKNHKKIIDTICHIDEIEIFKEKDILGYTSIYFLVGNDLMFKTRLIEENLYGSVGHFMTTMLNLILRERGKLERFNFVSDDLNAHLLIDPGAFNILDKKYRIGIAWDNY